MGFRYFANSEQRNHESAAVVSVCSPYVQTAWIDLFLSVTLAWPAWALRHFGWRCLWSPQTVLHNLSYILYSVQTDTSPFTTSHGLLFVLFQNLRKSKPRFWTLCSLWSHRLIFFPTLFPSGLIKSLFFRLFSFFPPQSSSLWLWPLFGLWSHEGVCFRHFFSPFEVIKSFAFETFLRRPHVPRYCCVCLL